MIVNEAGASSAEYALLLAIVGAGIILASMALGVSIGGAMNEASSEISN
jgi:pilus assembly protein Flp/PilA